jgi:hypothetical protein
MEEIGRDIKSELGAQLEKVREENKELKEKLAQMEGLSNERIERLVKDTVVKYLEQEKQKQKQNRNQ